MLVVQVLRTMIGALMVIFLFASDYTDTGHTNFVNQPNVIDLSQIQILKTFKQRNLDLRNMQL